MEPGRLRDRVTIQRPVSIQSASGAVTVHFQDWFTCWAEVTDLTVRELFTARQVASEATLKVRIRHRDGITAKMRVFHVKRLGSPTDALVYDIEGPPISMASGRELVLMCRRRDAEGFRSGNP